MLKNDVTTEEYEEITNGIIFNADNTTNKKCPRCGNDIVVEDARLTYTVRCKTPNCVFWEKIRAKLDGSNEEAEEMFGLLLKELGITEEEILAGMDELDDE